MLRFDVEFVVDVRFQQVRRMQDKIRVIPYVVVAGFWLVGWIVTIGGLASLQNDLPSSGAYSMDWYILFISLFAVLGFGFTESFGIDGWRRFCGFFLLFPTILYVAVGSRYASHSGLTSSESAYLAGLVIQSMALYVIEIIIVIEAENVLYQFLFEDIGRRDKTSRPNVSAPIQIQNIQSQSAMEPMSIASSEAV